MGEGFEPQFLRFQEVQNATFYEVCRADEVTIPPLCSKLTPAYEVIHSKRPYGHNLLDIYEGNFDEECEEDLCRTFCGPKHFRFEHNVSLMDKGCETWIINQLKPTIRISQWFKVTGEMLALRQVVQLLNEFNQPIWDTDEDLLCTADGSWKQNVTSISEYPSKIFHIKVIIWGDGQDADSISHFGGASVKLVFEEKSHLLAEELIEINQVWYFQCQASEGTPLPKLSSDCFLPDFEDLFKGKIPQDLGFQAEFSGSLGQGSRLLKQSIDQLFSRGFINLVVIGKTGVGKSSSLNSVLEHADVATAETFKESSAPRSCTKSMDHREIALSGQKIRLIDTVGLFDTAMTLPDQALHNVQEQDSEHLNVLLDLAKVIKMCSLDGVHGFLFVLQGGQRLTPDNIEAVGVIIRNLGLNVLDYVTFLVTHKDTASEDSLTELKETVTSYLAQQGYDARDEQFVYFNNKTRPRSQVDQLIHAVGTNLAEKEQIPYQHGLFVQAQQEFEAKKQRLIDEAEAELKKKVQQATDLLEVNRRSDGFRLLNSILLLRTKMETIRGDNQARKKEVESEIQHKQEQFEEAMRQKEKEIREAVTRQEEEVRTGCQPAIDRLQKRLNELNRKLLQH